MILSKSSNGKTNKIYPQSTAAVSKLHLKLSEHMVKNNKKIQAASLSGYMIKSFIVINLSYGYL